MLGPMIKIGPWSGFSLEGESSPATRRALFDEWANEALTQGGPYDWIHFVCLAQCLLQPPGMRVFHDLICQVGKDEEIAARVKKILAKGLDFSRAPDSEPVARADRDLVRMHADVGDSIKSRLRERGEEAALRVALYPSLFLLAWHEMPPALGDLLSLPLRIAYPDRISALGFRGRFVLREALKRAVANASKQGIGFSAAGLALESPLAFAASFARALKTLKWGRAKKKSMIEAHPLPEPVPLFAEDRPKKKLPHARAFDDELRRDHDILLLRGLKLLSAKATDPVEKLVEKVHRCVSAVQAGKRRLTSDQAAGLAVVWGDQLVRALQYQWAWVHSRGAQPRAGLVSPDRSLAHFPLPFITARRRRGGGKIPSRCSSTCCARETCRLPDPVISWSWVDKFPSVPHG
jgi:hypothetical protein